MEKRKVEKKENTEEWLTFDTIVDRYGLLYKKEKL